MAPSSTYNLCVCMPTWPKPIPVFHCGHCSHTSVQSRYCKNCNHGRTISSNESSPRHAWLKDASMRHKADITATHLSSEKCKNWAIATLQPLAICSACERLCEKPSAVWYPEKFDGNLDDIIQDPEDMCGDEAGNRRQGCGMYRDSSWVMGEVWVGSVAWADLYTLDGGGGEIARWKTRRILGVLEGDAEVKEIFPPCWWDESQSVDHKGDYWVHARGRAIIL